MNNKIIIIGADHAGFELKETIKNYLISEGFEIHDIGVYSKDTADYPLIAKQASDIIAENKYRAILICGTGIGMSIAANKIKGIIHAKIIIKNMVFIRKNKALILNAFI